MRWSPPPRAGVKKALPHLASCGCWGSNSGLHACVRALTQPSHLPSPSRSSASYSTLAFIILAIQNSSSPTKIRQSTPLPAVWALPGPGALETPCPCHSQMGCGGFWCSLGDASVIPDACLFSQPRSGLAEFTRRNPHAAFLTSGPHARRSVKAVSILIAYGGRGGSTCMLSIVPLDNAASLV